MRVGACSFTSLVVLLAATSAWAQPSDREQEQLRRLRLQVQQLQQAQTTAQEQAAAAQAARSKAEADLKAALEGQASQRGRSSAQQREAAALQASLAALRTERDALQTERDTVVAQARRTRLRLAQREAQLATSQQLLEQRADTIATGGSEQQRLARELDQCSAHNASLFTLGEELIQRLSTPTLWQRASANEPFLQLGRVRLENLGQQYRDRALTAQFKPAVPAAALKSGER